MLLESLGQPGFRELIVIATDLDSRRDLIGALVSEPYAQPFLAARPDRDRRAEVLDLAGAGRDRAIDLVAAALTPPVGFDPWLVTFAPDSHWRGETHRCVDRPGTVHRLLEEVAAAGVTQIVVVSACAAESDPHRLRAAPLDPRQRLGEFIVAAEAAALRDALEMARLRFDAVFTIRPSHNALGPVRLRRRLRPGVGSAAGVRGADRSRLRGRRAGSSSSRSSAPAGNTWRNPARKDSASGRPASRICSTSRIRMVAPFPQG